MHPSVIQDPEDLVAALREEMVIGHSDYWRAANTAVHFRRCFGEVFGSRSFLFLGSGLSDEYFLNLFGKSLELRGPSPEPHFAFLPRNQDIHVRFLAEEINIIVCEYDEHQQLIPWLKTLKEALQKMNRKANEGRPGFDTEKVN